MVIAIMTGKTNTVDAAVAVVLADVFFAMAQPRRLPLEAAQAPCTGVVASGMAGSVYQVPVCGHRRGTSQGCPGGQAERRLRRPSHAPPPARWGATVSHQDAGMPCAPSRRMSMSFKSSGTTRSYLGDAQWAAAPAPGSLLRWPHEREKQHRDVNGQAVAAAVADHAAE